MASLLDVKDLRTHFFTRDGIVKAVDGVSFSIEKGETLGIVGESGSGKSVSVQSILGLIPTPPGRIVGGSAIWDGKLDLLQSGRSNMRRILGTEISMIFQDPMTCLNPFMTIGQQLAEVVTTHRKASRSEAMEVAVQRLDEVGIPDARKRLSHYPHQFSGGMRQRVMIAMALMNRPRLLIADEPTTALDVTVQAQILELLKQLQETHGMALIVITHDLGVVAGIADKVLVMYAGRPVEHGAVHEVFQRTAHPYTQGLLRSAPSLTQNRSDDLFSISGLPPDTARLGPGCAFAPRCIHVRPDCRSGNDIPSRRHSITHHSVCHMEQNP
jgi:oligopeptide/dipeptide ABC transporter ATP-binding protein